MDASWHGLATRYESACHLRALLTEMASGKMALQYWPLWAKGLAPGVALEVSGADWELAPAPGSKGTGNLWNEWLEMKPTTPWGFLPNLILPSGKKIGSELAILQYLARHYETLRGANEDDELTSQELLHQGEELYQKITKNVPTAMESVPAAQFNEFWNGSDKATHSKKQGLVVYLQQFEDFFGKCGGSGGKYTSTGTTIGEIKVFATMQILIKLQADILEPYPKLKEFVDTLMKDSRVAGVVNQKAKNMTANSWNPYFKKA